MCSPVTDNAISCPQRNKIPLGIGDSQMAGDWIGETNLAPAYARPSLCAEKGRASLGLSARQGCRAPPHAVVPSGPRRPLTASDHPVRTDQNLPLRLRRRRLLLVAAAVCLLLASVCDIHLGKNERAKNEVKSEVKK